MIWFLNLYIVQVKGHGIWCDCHTSERFSAIKPVSIHYFSTFENACIMSGIWQLSIRLMCFIIWFCHFIREFPFWIFVRGQYFCNFTFFQALYTRELYKMIFAGFVVQENPDLLQIRVSVLISCSGLKRFTSLIFIFIFFKYTFLYISDLYLFSDRTALNSC